MRLRVALVGGPAYDPLYETLAQFTARTGIAVEVGFQAPHMDLNRLGGIAPAPEHTARQAPRERLTALYAPH